MMIKKQYPTLLTLFLLCTIGLFSCKKAHKDTLMQDINNRDSITLQTYLNKVYHQQIKDTIKGFWRHSSYDRSAPLWQFGLIFQRMKDDDSIQGTYHLIRQGGKQENGLLKGVLIKGKATAELYNPQEFPGEKSKIELTGWDEKSYDGMQLTLIKVPARLSYLSETFVLYRVNSRRPEKISGCAYPGHIRRKKNTTNKKN